MIEPPQATERLLLFEIGGSAYALPISEVLEVAEAGRIWGIPTLPAGVAGVINHRGDALPIVMRERLFEGTPDALPAPEHVLVLGAVEESGRLGVPVDRVLGLLDGMSPRAGGSGLVVERRPVRGQIVAFLDARRLLERAARAIQEPPATPAATEGGVE